MTQIEKRMPKKLLFAANWKMNKLVGETPEFVQRLTGLLADIPEKLGSEYQVVIGAPATHLTLLIKSLKDSSLEASAQNSGVAKFGAYTGEISPAMLKDIGCGWTIVGHSERRHFFKEDDLLVLSRTKAALEEGLKVILCVGEVLQERNSGKTTRVIENQLSILKQNQIDPSLFENLVIAYEPVWAIGTGETATPAQAQEVHHHIRSWCAKNLSDQASSIRILYGGSVKPENSQQILSQPDVDGLLVGGASLDPVVFANLVKNGLKSRTTKKEL